jgi:hypothetical protein
MSKGIELLYCFPSEKTDDMIVFINNFTTFEARRKVNGLTCLATCMVVVNATSQMDSEQQERDETDAFVNSLLYLTSRGNHAQIGIDT